MKNEMTAINLIADIRAAVGDPKGKLMQDELVAHCAELKRKADLFDSDVKQRMAKRIEKWGEKKSKIGWGNHSE